MLIDAVDTRTATERILSWASRGESRYVCVANAHTLMEAHDSQAFRSVLAEADMVTPDGMPLVWMIRFRGVGEQQRVYGPTLMRMLLELASASGLPVAFYGSTSDTLERLVSRLADSMPSLSVVDACSPAFRELTGLEDVADVERITRSGARIVFVGLGCPKQERWMASHRGRIPAVMIGVGAAFDFLAGTKLQASPALQSLGLEWLFRLAHEPRRLWKRYLVHNPRFAALALAELLGLRRS